VFFHSVLGGTAKSSCPSGGRLGCVDSLREDMFCKAPAQNR